MAKLAIRGHEGRGEKVIEILEMLGGMNTANMSGYGPSCGYYINSNGHISCKHYCGIDDDVIKFTLEEFLEKFPYIVGDKVQHKGATSCGSVFEVEKMRWEGTHVEYTIKCLWDNNCYATVTAEDLQPYKEETMEKVKDNWAKWDLPDGYEFQDAEGNVIKTGVIKLVKKQPQYPKTFIEVLNFWHPDRQLEDDYQRCYKKDLIEKIQDLLYARDAYWKIAGEKMGLDKPWEPDYSEESYEQGSPIKYVIYYTGTHITKGQKCTPSYILTFPTEEMRDAFYENFKELIESCKELL